MASPSRVLEGDEAGSSSSSAAAFPSSALALVGARRRLGRRRCSGSVGRAGAAWRACRASRIVDERHDSAGETSEGLCAWFRPFSARFALAAPPTLPFLLSRGHLKTRARKPLPDGLHLSARPSAYVAAVRRPCDAPAPAAAGPRGRGRLFGKFFFLGVEFSRPKAGPFWSGDHRSGAQTTLASVPEGGMDESGGWSCLARPSSLRSPISRPRRRPSSSRGARARGRQRHRSPCPLDP